MRFGKKATMRLSCASVCVLAYPISWVKEVPSAIA